MPHVSIKMTPGRSEHQKTQLAEQILHDLVAIAHCREEDVSVVIDEINQSDWVEKVYKPDILKNWDKLYRKPGYDPS